MTDEVGKIGISGIIDNLTGNRGVSGTMLPAGTIDISSTEDLENLLADKVGERQMADDPVVSVSQNSVIPDLPHIHDVERNVHCSEPEWIAIYAFYASNHGKDTFTKSEVQQIYLSKRSTQPRKKKFHDNWNSLFKHYFSTVKEGTFRLKSTKLPYLIDLISGKEKGSAKPTGRKKTTVKKAVVEPDTSEITPGSGGKTGKKKKSGGLPSVVADLNLYPKGEQSLNDFYGSFSPKSNFDKNLIFVYYLTQKLKLTPIGVDHIFTCYRQIGVALPSSIAQSIIDTSFHKSWVSSADLANIQLTTSGLNYLEQSMAKKDKA
ncbi:hypothetical protein C7T94_10760 [Pedobacter yulinensis]|uniref:Uncharacterized protein n=1 Tax=Pedobacter yulinensis TaxID=2126353 RepID=A0A2T3HKV2_9SPHI|nr:hypothetical protein C7T94_10760 [Pedobacter yulinensis]